MIGQPKPSSPKRRAAAVGTEGWYRYYAGYSSEFVRDVLQQLGLGASDTLLDPWNGAGTTTAVALQEGIGGLGYDLNPAMVVVAKAQLLGRSVTPSELPLARTILATAAPVRPCDAEDLLLTWFAPAGASAIRTVERSLRKALQENAEPTENVSSFVSGLSPLGAFYYLALFRTVREYLAPFQTSNPTWLRSPASPKHRLRPSLAQVRSRFLAQTHAMAMTLSPTVPASHIPVGHAPRIDIAIGDSTNMSCETRSLAAAITSPPYCTRIDYAKATAPELALLGQSAEDFGALRARSIGAAITTSLPVAYNDGWGPSCARFLERVAQHPSKASHAYYLRNHLQYFDGIFRSICELDRVLEEGAPCILVVQDSYYKEVHNDLPRVFTEMADGLGWILQERHDYPATALMSRVHPSRSNYRSTSAATEAVMWFTTAA